MIDMLAILIIAGMAILGRSRGTIGMGLLAAGLVGGYATALILARPIGSLLAGASGLPEIMAYPLAGMIVLFAASTGINIFARRWRRERAFKMENGWEPPAWDANGGTALGVGYGVILAMILAWMGSSLGGLSGQGQGLESVRSSLIGRASSVVTEQAFSLAARGWAGDRFTSRAMAHFVADPAGATEALNAVMADERVERLFASGAIQRAAVSGNPDLLARDPSLAALARDEVFVTALRDFGVLEAGEGPAPPAEVSAAITREVGPVVRSVESLKRDEEIQRIIQSPSFRGALERRDYMALARDPGFEHIFERVMEELDKLR
jgi:hypothetical protein